MQSVTTIGLDIAKSVFQVHGVDADGNVVVRRQLKRRYVLAFFQKLPPCLVGIEACASSHYWSRELQALGHTVRLIPPAYVKPYVKRQKNDAADAEAICEAVTRPNMRFVATKTPEQQSCLTLHRTRHLFIRQQTAVINSIRAYLAEFGIIAPVGRSGVEALLEVVADANDTRLPEIAERRTSPTEGIAVSGLFRRGQEGPAFCGQVLASSLYRRVRPILAVCQLLVPMAALVFVGNAGGLARNELLPRGTFRGLAGEVVGREGLGEDAISAVSPAAVMLDDLVSDLVHRSILVFASRT